MFRKILSVALIALVSAGMAWGQAVDEHTMAYWALDEGTGTVVSDSSGNGNNGVIEGGAWETGMLGNALYLAGQPNRVVVPNSESLHSTTGDITLEAWIKVTEDPTGWSHAGAIVFKPNAYLWVVHNTGALWFGIWGAALRTTDLYEFQDHIGEWHHAAVTFEGDSQQAIIYVDGQVMNQGTVNEQVDQSTNDLYMGHKTDSNSWFQGILDEIRISDVVRTQEEIQAFMSRKAGQAVDPVPAEDEADVLRDPVLSWTGSDLAVAHDVYFGTTFDDVNNASRDDPMGVLVSEGQTDTTFEPGRLEFDRTYYWRVDGLSNVAGTTVYKGRVWSFTVESLVYPVENIVATSNATSLEGQGAERLVDGSGLDENDLHSDSFGDMWSGTPDAEAPTYVLFEFDRPYKLSDMLVWNYNVAFEVALGYGVKEATIEYSQDGVDWTVFGDVELAQAPCIDGYAVNNTIALDGISAQYVRMTVVSNFAGSTAQYALSEVRFTHIPVHPSDPDPAEGDTDVAVDTMLGWKRGREAASHEIGLGTDPEALTTIATTTESTYGPASLDLESTYYWQVTEVNEAETPSGWTGDLWSFSTQEYLVVDDFEAYTDDSDAGEAIWQTWVDGVDDAPNSGGSTVGHDTSPFAEMTTVHGGFQSMPLFFDNSVYNWSQATRTFETPQDWNAYGIESLTLYIHGDAANEGGQLYVKINETKATYDSVSDILDRPQWVLWPIDLTASGADLSNVTTVSIGVDGAGASGVVYVDDVRLYGRAAVTVEPTLPGDDDPNLVAYYPFEGNGDDTLGTYDGSINGSPEFVDGLVGQAISFNGVNDSVIYTYAQETVWPASSVVFWVKPMTLGQELYASAFNNNSSASDFQVDVDGAAPGTFRYHGSIDMFYGVVTTEWTHLATVCDGTETTLYYNGLIADSGAVADLNYGRIAFGLNRASDRWLEALVDEARLFNRPLSPGEVAALAGITEPIVESF